MCGSCGGGGVHHSLFSRGPGTSLAFTCKKVNAPLMPEGGGRRGFQMTGALGRNYKGQSTALRVENKRHAMHAEAMTFHKRSLIIFRTFVKKLGYIKVTDNFCAE